jgi:hypothetical protein
MTTTDLDAFKTAAENDRAALIDGIKIIFN